MSDNSDTHHRRSIRLEHYDYSSPGGYFVTICSHQWQCLFGEIADHEMRLNAWGEIIRDEWLRTPAVRSNVELDGYVIMPNHFHGIILIHAGTEKGDAPIRNGAKGGAHIGAPAQAIDHVLYGRTESAPLHDDAENKAIRRRPGSLGSIIAGFKSAVTKRINELRRPIATPVWHRNYYEHVIRGEKDLQSIREYIINNPQKWHEDENNPERKI
jgi:putative transposase